VKRGILVAAGLIVLTAAGATVARAIQYDGAAKPGVSVLGIDVGGQSRAEIERDLAAWSKRPVTIRAGGRSYHVPRGWLVSVDARATSKRALSAGSPVALVVPSHDEVAPVLARAGGAADVLREIGRAERPAVAASVALRGATVVVSPARVGRELDRAALLELLAGDASTIDAPFSEVQPAIRDPAARSAGSTARVLLDRPVALTYHGSARSRRSSSHGRCASRRASTATWSRSIPRRSHVSFARASDVGPCARTTPSSRSRARACTSCRHARAATSIRNGSPRR
jgi:hypothetical protein